MRLIRSITSVGFFTIASRLAGFVREAFMAGIIGVGPVTDALSIAIKLPSTFRRLLAEGAFNAVFVPTFSGLVSADGKPLARTWAQHIFNFLVFVLVLLVLFFEVFADLILRGLLSGFEAERLEMAITFSRITFPFILFISLTALYSGILNSLDRFAAAASSPMAGNIFIIFFFWGFHQHMTSPGHSFAYAIMISGVVQLIWVVVPAAMQGFLLPFRMPHLTQDVRHFLKQMVPGAIGSGITHINAFIGMMLASFLPKGGPSILNFSDRLGQLPLSVIGAAVSTALLPLVSRQLRNGNTTGAMKSQNRALEFTLLLALPSTFILIFLCEPLVAVAYERGKFTPEMTAETAKTLIAYACGLPAFILTKVFTTSFFARKDTRTPMIIAGISVVLDVGLTVALMGPYQHIGVAMAQSITAWGTVGMLAFRLRRLGYFVIDDHFHRFIPRMAACLGLTSGIMYGVYRLMESYLFATGGVRITATLVFLAIAIGVYFACAQVTRAARLKDLANLTIE